MCSTNAILEWFFIGLEIDITMFNPKNSQLFPSFEMTINLKTRFSPGPCSQHRSIIYIYNWGTKTWVQAMTFSRNPNSCPFNLLSLSRQLWQLHVWNFTALGVLCIKIGVIIGNGFVYLSVEDHLVSNTSFALR